MVPANLQLLLKKLASLSEDDERWGHIDLLEVRTMPNMELESKTERCVRDVRAWNVADALSMDLGLILWRTEWFSSILGV